MNPVRDPDYEVVILGAGPAGSTAGIYLARFRFRALLLETADTTMTGTDWAARSGIAGYYYNVPGFPEGIQRYELKWRCIQQAQIAGCDYRLDKALSVTQNHGSYTVTCETGSYTTRALIFAMGVEDTWPEVPGLEKVAENAMFWSVYANGYEAIEKPAAIIGNDEHAILEAIRLHTYTPHVSLLTNGYELTSSPDVQDILTDLNIPIFITPIASLQNEGDYLHGVILEDHHMVPAEILFSASRKKTPRSMLAQSLGVHVDAAGVIQVNERFETNIPDVFAIGDITSRGPEQVVTSYYHGMQAAWALNEERFHTRLHQLLSHVHH
jgi:thioredoxin reductase (NADPH)